MNLVRSGSGWQHTEVMPCGAAAPGAHRGPLGGGGSSATKPASSSTWGPVAYRVVASGKKEVPHNLCEQIWYGADERQHRATTRGRGRAPQAD